jgi:hypothetical protein
MAAPAPLLCRAQSGDPSIVTGAFPHGEPIDLGYRIDLLVENLVIVELKCVECTNPTHKA